MSLEHRVRAVISPVEYKPTIKDKIIDFWDDASGFLFIRTNVSMEEYVKLPYNKRHRLGFWYVEPMFDMHDFRGNDEYFKKKYPIQYFIREKILMRLTHRYVSTWWYENVSAKLNPRQKWLMKGIPSTWSDKVWLIPEINFKMVTHFIEEEKCFDHTDYENSGELHAIFAKELKECYDYIKNERPTLTKQMEDAYPTKELKNLSYEERYGEVNRIEKEIEDKDTKWLVWIVSNRNMFWT